MKNVLTNKLSLSFLLLIIFSCNKRNDLSKVDAPKFENFYEKTDSITIKNELVYIEKFYTKNDLAYVIKYKNKYYEIPFNFYNLQAYPDIEKINKPKNEFVVKLYVGSNGLYIYDIKIINNELFLSKIIRSDIKSDIKTDSLIVNKNWKKIDSIERKKILIYLISD